MGQLSEAKQTSHEGDQILGHKESGGIIQGPRGPLALKHNKHRFNHGSQSPWGRQEYAYVEADLIAIGYHLDPLPPTDTVIASEAYLAALKEGEIPEEATIGVEVEACVYDVTGNSLRPATGELWPLSQNSHPELLDHMLETATGKAENGQFPRSATEIAHAVARALLSGYEIAHMQQKLLAYSSVPESGSSEQIAITQHPYLLAFSPKVLEQTVQQAASIPPEVISLYQQIGIDIVPYLQQTGVLNWPVNALHVHNGVPQIEGLADPRAAYAMAQLRMTGLAKILSLPLYNTRHCFGVDTGLMDVRSIMRRLLATSHGAPLPTNVGEFINQAILALEDGSIHSLPRHPWQGQHDRIRLRMDGDKKTMESIDAPMTPDVRQILSWIYTNQILNAIALQALAVVGGDESKVLPYLEIQYGPLMKPLPALGTGSCLVIDLCINQEGLHAALPDFNITAAQALIVAQHIIEQHSSLFPALHTQIKAVSHVISQTVSQIRPSSLEEYLGIESGVYKPNNLNRGPITQMKEGIPPQELVLLQDQTTRLQAETLISARDEVDLLLFMGAI